MIRNVMLVAAAVALASCDSEVGGSRTTFTFSGTSFAGQVPLSERYVWSGPSLPTAFSVLLTDKLGSCGAPAHAVELYVPEAVYAGPGTYRCGTDPFGGYQGAFCTITVRHTFECAAVGEWTTWGVSREDGSYGELPGCSITVEEDDTIVRGTATCAGLAFRAFQGTHPDAGTTLALDGRFYADR
jgi:hypothetical protein